MYVLKKLFVREQKNDSFITETMKCGRGLMGLERERAMTLELPAVVSCGPRPHGSHRGQGQSRKTRAGSPESR